MKTFHFFDLDHTVLGGNSSAHFVWYLYKRNYLSLATLLKISGYYSLYTVGCISCSELYERTSTLFFLGQPIELFKREVEAFLNGYWRRMLDLVGFDLFTRARLEGDQVVILSSSPQFLVEAFSKRLDADACYGTQYDVDTDGIVCAITTIMDGKCKAAQVQKLARGSSSFAYSDSHHDIPFLEAVDTPVAVNPNRKLTAIARRRGWMVARK